MVEFESAEFNKVFASLNVGELCGLDKELYKADSKNMFAFMTKRVNEADFPKEGEDSFVDTLLTMIYVASLEYGDVRTKTLNEQIALLEALSQKEFLDESGEETTALKMIGGVLQLIHTDFSKPKVMRAAVPIECQLLEKDPKQKATTLQQTIPSYLGMIDGTNAKLLVPYAKLFVSRAFSGKDLYKGSYMGCLTKIMDADPSALEGCSAQVLEVFEDGDVSSQMTAATMLQKIIKTDWSWVEGAMDALIDALPQTHGSMVAVILGEYGEKEPAKLALRLDDIEAAMTGDGFKYYLAKMYGCCGRAAESDAKKYQEKLAKIVGDGGDAMAATYIMEMKNIAGVYKSTLEPYVEQLKGIVKNTSNEGSRTLAQSLVDYYEDRTLQSLDTAITSTKTEVKAVKDATETNAAKLDDHEKRLMSVEEVVLDVKKYVDENMAEIKEFVAGVVKKLPIPMDLTKESAMLKTRKKLLLHFSCAKCTAGTCIYNGTEKTFTTETSVWQKWVKVSFCAFQTGKAAWDKDFGGVVDGLKGLYCAATDNEAADFVAFISEPFLTSTEQDALIDQLRAAHFFDHFVYDAQLGNWVCFPCGGKTAQEKKVAEASTGEEAEAAVGSVAVPTAAGDLYKKSAGLLNKDWKKIVPRIEGNTLHWMAVGKKSPKQVAFANMVAATKVDERKCGKANAFQIVEAGVMHMFYCSTAELCDAWVACLTTAIVNK